MKFAVAKARVPLRSGSDEIQMAFVHTMLLENVEGSRSHASYSRRTLLNARLRGLTHPKTIVFHARVK